MYQMEKMFQIVLKGLANKNLIRLFDVIFSGGPGNSHIWIIRGIELFIIKKFIFLQHGIEVIMEKACLYCDILLWLLGSTHKVVMYT